MRSPRTLLAGRDLEVEFRRLVPRHLRRLSPLARGMLGQQHDLLYVVRIVCELAVDACITECPSLRMAITAPNFLVINSTSS